LRIVQSSHGRVPKSHASITGKALVVERLGSETIAYLGLADGTQLTVKMNGGVTVNPGDDMSTGLAPEAVTLFGPDGLALRPGRD
jgi:multiple sugar transport system ATP-binding protein